MKTLLSAVMVLFVLFGGIALGEAQASGPPAPVPYREIPDPPDDAERHIAVKAEDRGPVWLYTGFLNTWHPEMDLDMIAWVRPKHWRDDLWPFWFSHLITADHEEKWRDYRDSPVYLGKYMGTMMRLQKEGMTWQIVLHHRGRYYGRFRITADMLDDFYDHIYTIVRYCRDMGAPFDYYEVCNEPGNVPYEGVDGHGFRGTCEDFLGMWDTACRAIRDAYPEARIVGPSCGSTRPQTMASFQHPANRARHADRVFLLLRSWGGGPGGEGALDAGRPGRSSGEPQDAKDQLLVLGGICEAGWGVRLVTATDDRCVVALASRHDEAKEMRVVLARSKRYTGRSLRRSSRR